MVHHRRGPDDPGVAGAVASLPFLGTEDIRLLLGLADEQDAFVPLEPGQILLGHVVFSLPLPEPHQVDLFGLDEVFHGFHEPAAHRRDHGCRGHTHAQLGFLEVGPANRGFRSVLRCAISHYRRSCRGCLHQNPSSTLVDLEPAGGKWEIAVKSIRTRGKQFSVQLVDRVCGGHPLFIRTGTLVSPSYSCGRFLGVSDPFVLTTSSFISSPILCSTFSIFSLANSGTDRR